MQFSRPGKVREISFSFKLPPIFEPEMHLDFKIAGNITDLQRGDLVLGPLLHKAKKQEQEIELDINTRDHMYSQC